TSTSFYAFQHGGPNRCCPLSGMARSVVQLRKQRQAVQLRRSSGPLAQSQATAAFGRSVSLRGGGGACVGCSLSSQQLGVMNIDIVVFKSQHFRVEPGEDKETNPGIYGKALAQWILQKLKARGYEVDDDLVAEDFGWLVMLRGYPFMLWVGCASVEE